MWDATGKDTKWFSDKIKSDLGGEKNGVKKAPNGLKDLIRSKLTGWLVGTVDSSTIEGVKNRYFPILTQDQQAEVSQAAVNRGAIVDPQVSETLKLPQSQADGSTPSITRAELEDAIPKNLKRIDKKVTIDQLMKSPNIKDVSLWDGTNWKENISSAWRARQWGMELAGHMATTGGSQDIIAIANVPTGLRKLIQSKITD